MAVPVNCLANIAFQPPLAPPSAHAGRAAKTWTRAEGVPAGAVSSGWPGLVETYTITGAAGVAVAGFQLRQGSVEEQDAGWMDGAITSGADTAARAAAYLNGGPVPLARG